MPDLPDLKDLPPDRWIYLERPRYCTNCSVEIEAGKKALFFPSPSPSTATDALGCSLAS